jgi:hypothetical protein
MSDASMPHCDVCEQPEYACTCPQEHDAQELRGYSEQIVGRQSVICRPQGEWRWAQRVTGYVICPCCGLWVEIPGRMSG